MKEYVLGFLADEQYLLLIDKPNKGPDGEGLNGVGGKVEEGEAPDAAMAREWTEETGLPDQVWRKSLVAEFGQHARVHVYFASTDCLPDVHGRVVEEGNGSLAVLEWPYDVFGGMGSSADRFCPQVRLFLAYALYERQTDDPPTVRFP